jgi:type I restriction enzyme S subunit
MAGERKIKRLGDICEFRGGQGFPHLHQGAIIGEYPFIKVSDMELPGNRHRINRANHWIDEATRKQLRAKPHPATSTVFAKIGIALTYNRRRLLSRPTIVDNNMMAAVPIESEVDPLFLYYLLKVTDFNEVVSGTALPFINGSDLARMEVNIPPLPEQRSIASVLGTLDDLIELNRETNEILEEMARALFKSWFVDFDPVRAKLEGRPPAGMDAATAALFPDHFQDSELGQIPKGWRVGKFGDVCASSRQGVSPDAINPETPYIGLEHMPRRSIALDEWETAAKVSSGKSAFNKGEILFGKLRPYFHKVGVAPVNGVCSTDILVLLPKVPDWFGLVLGHASSDALVQFADQSSAGTKMPRTNWKDLSSFKVAIPPLNVASAFSRIVCPQVETILANIHESRDLAALRDTLLPKLLSGEVCLEELMELSA